MAEGNLAGHDVRQRIDEQGWRRIIIAVRDGGEVIRIVLDARASVCEYDGCWLGAVCWLFEEYFCGYKTQAAEGVHLEELGVVASIPTVEFDEHFVACRFYLYRVSVQEYRCRSYFYFLCYSHVILMAAFTPPKPESILMHVPCFACMAQRMVSKTPAAPMV